MKIFKPRPVQLAGLDHILNVPRANLFASPGTGKTTTVLSALDARHLVGDDVFPCLVVSLLRVANTVWDSEVESWENFQWIKVSKILGSADERKAALKRKAHLYTINFENMMWLRETLGNAWPFKTVIVDESTKIKNHRCSRTKRADGTFGVRRGGAKNAAALVAAFAHTAYWVNLSGTPTPRSEVDLWGQQWPLDGGKALGNSYADFCRNFCELPWGATPQQNRWQLRKDAQGRVLDLIRPQTVVLDAYDWFDIDKPIEINVPVELPAKAKELYDALHQDSVCELEGGLVLEAPSASASLMKCRQVASGAVLSGEAESRVLTHIHDAKLQALKDIWETNGKEPLLVAYYFRYEAEAIINYFGDKVAVQMPNGAKQKQVEQEWNEGKIPMLLVHPASAGHGLNLQHGSNKMVLFTPDWNYELYAQVIERIGTTRQKQSGYDRPVYIYRLFARGTWDEVILANLGKKYQTSEIVKAALSVRDGQNLLENTE